MSALPWVRFFPSDWLAGTRGMTAAEMGVYISLIAMMYERGEPLVEDFPRLARLCGASNSQFKKTLGGLLDDGKITRKDGGLWNDRVEKEQSYRSEKSEVGKRAAGQRWQKDEQNQHQRDAGAMRSQCQGNANQKPEAREEKNEPKGSTSGEVGPPDYRTELFREGLASLSRQTGKPESRLRGLVGGWLKDAKDDARLVLTKIRQAEADRILDPVPWVREALKASTAPKRRTFEEERNDPHSPWFGVI